MLCAEAYTTKEPPKGTEKGSDFTKQKIGDVSGGKYPHCGATCRVVSCDRSPFVALCKLGKVVGIQRGEKTFSRYAQWLKETHWMGMGCFPAWAEGTGANVLSRRLLKARPKEACI